MTGTPASHFAPPSDEEHHRLRLELSGLPYRPLTPPSHHHVVLRGMRFHYVEWGRRDARPILFLHGGGQTCRTWDVVCHELSLDYRCIALDQRGHGDSEWSYEFDYRPETQARDIADLVEALALQPLVIVGMSMGCLNGLYYALERPATVAAFVAVDAGPWVEIAAAAPIRKFLRHMTQLGTLEEFLAAAQRFNPRRDARLLHHSLRHNLRRCPDGRLMWKTDLRRPVDAAAAAARIAALRERVGEIACPTLVIRGGDSRIMREEDARRFAQALPDGRWLSIEGAGHTVQGDQPKALVEALRRFLAGLTRSAGPISPLAQ